MSDMFISKAKHYVDLSNQHQLALIPPLFTHDATYYSEYFGEYRGKESIHAMMVDFFTRFPDAHWEVPAYHALEKDGVEFEFIMTGTHATSGESVVRHGMERIFFNSDGLIRHIAVYKPKGKVQST